MKLKFKRLLKFFIKEIKSTKKKLDILTSKQAARQQNLNISSIIISFSVILPIAAFTYWQIFIGKFGKEYFSFCFNLTDIPYILYSKGTLLFLGITSFVFPALAVYCVLTFSKYRRELSIGIWMLLSLSAFCIFSHLRWYLCILYPLMALVIMVIFYIRDKNSVFAYVWLTCLIFVNVAEADAEHILLMPIKKDIQRKDGTYILTKCDQNRFYVASTSNFILIYNQLSNDLEKIEQASVR